MLSVRKKLAGIALGAGLVASGAAGAYALTRDTRPSEQVPIVLNVSLDQARQMANAADLKIRVASGRVRCISENTAVTLGTTNVIRANNTDVPTTSIRSHSSASWKARLVASAGIASPKKTAAGFMWIPPQRRQRGGSSSSRRAWS